jgi:hypothetical protein
MSLGQHRDIKRCDMSDIGEVSASILKPRAKRELTEKQREALARGRQLRHSRSRTPALPDSPDAQDAPETQELLSPSTDEPQDSPVVPTVRTRRSQARPKRSLSPSQENSGRAPNKYRRVDDDDLLMELRQLREQMQSLQAIPKKRAPAKKPRAKPVARNPPADAYEQEEAPRPTHDRLNYFV